MPMGFRFFIALCSSRDLMCLVALELDLADFDLGAFLHHERQRDGGGRNGPHFRADGGELVAVRGQQFFDDNFGVLHLGGIVLAFLRQSDLEFFELVEHVALRDRTQADVFDFADGRLFFHVNVNDPALGRLLALDAQVVKVAGVPQGIEVALQRRLVVNIAGAGEHAGADGVGRDAAVAVDDDLFDHVLAAPKHVPSKKKTARKQQIAVAQKRVPAARAAPRVLPDYGKK